MAISMHAIPQQNDVSGRRDMRNLIITTTGRLFRAALGVALSTVLVSMAAAQTPVGYPDKPVRIVVPYGPGGIADVTMRIVAENLSKRYGQQFFIENRPGAGGIVGMQAALQAPADGYTMVMIGGGLTIAKALFKHLPYDIEKDIEPVSTTASYSLVMVTKAESPFKSVSDFVAAARSHPGAINIGTINAGSTQNLSAELFRIRTGIDVTIVPYKTTPELANAILRGDVQAGFEYFAGLVSPIFNKQMTVLATTGRERAPNLPNVPTMMESGVQDYDVTSWNGLAVRQGTPASVIKLLNGAIKDALATPRVQQFAEKVGVEAHGMDPAALRARISSDVAQWKKLVQQAGIKRR
jgi:tripartite-type tricarboxylate transporter receptor subunit TctC